MEEETKLMEAGKNRTVYGLLAEYEKAADKAAKISREKTLANEDGKVYACEMLLWMSGISKVKDKYEFALLGKEVQV
jgi:peroxiredoxin family protein